jgi:hypothetical protein
MSKVILARLWLPLKGQLLGTASGQRWTIIDMVSGKASYWIPVVRQHNPVSPIVLVDTTTFWNTKNELNPTSNVEDGMLLAEQNNAVTYMKCSCNMDDINAVFVAAVRASEKAKQLQAALANTPQPALDQRPQSALDTLKQFLTRRRSEVQ